MPKKKYKTPTIMKNIEVCDDCKAKDMNTWNEIKKSSNNKGCKICSC